MVEFAVNTPSGDFIEKGDRPELPWFDNARGKYPSGQYQITCAVFITATEKYLLETSKFKLMLDFKESPQGYECISNAIAKMKLCFVVVNRTRVAFCDADSAHECFYRLEYTEKSERYTPELIVGDLVETDPKRALPSRSPRHLMEDTKPPF